MPEDQGGNVEAAKKPQARLLNVNVGVLGHVDSGKTSLGEPHQRGRPAPTHAHGRQSSACADA